MGPPERGPDDGSGVAEWLFCQVGQGVCKYGRAGADLRLDAKVSDALATHRRSLPTPNASAKGPVLLPLIRQLARAIHFLVDDAHLILHGVIRRHFK